MSPLVIACVLIVYFIALFAVAVVTSKKADNASFFKANKSASWVLVAFGMIGTSLSGVTFVSVPGTVSAAGMQYFTMALGFFAGYFVVAFVFVGGFKLECVFPFKDTNKQWVCAVACCL